MQTNIMNALDVSAIVAQTDLKGKITYVNSKFEELSGYSKEELIGKDHRIVNSGLHPDLFFRDMWETIRKGDVWKGEIRNRTKGGTFYWVDTTIVPLKDELGHIDSFISIRFDITNRKLLEEKLLNLSFVDPQTLLPNRKFVKHSIDQLVQHDDVRFAVTFLDLENLKQINETLGHTVGDEVIKMFSDRLKARCGEGATVGRWAGDEFVMIIPNVVSKDTVCRFITSLEQEVSEPYVIKGNKLYIKPNIGVAYYPTDGVTSEILIQHASSALNSAKMNGTERITFYTANLSKNSKEKLYLATELHQAIESEELFLVYQPQLHIQTGRIVGTEALVRWRHPKLGIISPDKFIPLAEQIGLIPKITRWVLKTAALKNRNWKSLGNFEVSVNVSANDIWNGDIAVMVMETLEETGLEPSSLKIEVTENAALKNEEAMFNVFSKLRELGVKIAIDDFGTGYSSLRYLKDFPFDTLKIDKSFVDGIPYKHGDVSIIKTVTQLAHHLRVCVVAEGVETKEQFQFLKKLGVDVVQGYYVHKPLEPSQVTRILETMDHPRRGILDTMA